MARSGRFVFIAQWVAAALLPAVFFWASAWVMARPEPAVQTPYGVLAIPLLVIPPFLTLFDAAARRERSTRVAYDAASFILWFAIVFGGLTLPDTLDPPRDSTLMNTFGIPYLSGPSPAFYLAAALIVVAYAAQLVLAVMGIIRGRHPVAA